MAWRIVFGPKDASPADFDAQGWLFEVENEDGLRKRVYVQVAGQVINLGPKGMPKNAVEAGETKGQSAVEAVLAWPEPPDRLEFDSEAEEPQTSGGMPPEQ